MHTIITIIVFVTISLAMAVRRRERKGALPLSPRIGLLQRRTQSVRQVVHANLPTKIIPKLLRSVYSKIPGNSLWT